MAKSLQTRNSEKLRPLIEKAIHDGEVFIIEKWGVDSGSIYEVRIGSDQDWFYDGPDFFIPILIHVNDAGVIKWKFAETSIHALDKPNTQWLGAELEELLEMYKLGGIRRPSQEGPHLRGPDGVYV